MDLQIRGRRAIVTGASAGIGLAIAKSLAGEGATVFITGRTTSIRHKADEIARATGATVHGVEADLATAKGAQTLFEHLPETDILVNNLGIYEAKPFENITDADWQQIFETNVLSGVRTARFYFPKMLSANAGRIIFIASESGLMTPPDMIHYGMTKSAQMAVSRGLAELTKGTRVTVNTVLPGPTRSANIEDFMRSISESPSASLPEIEAEFFRRHRQSSLLQRLIDADEIASLVTYLASPLSAATNGAAIRAEGGLLRSIA